jgi:hypothetical protein
MSRSLTQPLLGSHCVILINSSVDMHNLLSEKDKKIVHREYMLRVAAVTLILLLIAILISGAFLAPSYFIAVSKEKTALKNADIVEKLIELREKDISVSALSETKDAINLLSINRNHAPLKSVIETIINGKPLGISIRSLFYEVKGDKNIITINGVSSKRENLLAFKKRLENENLFQSVVLPISNLASDEDIRFSINITGKW